MADYHVIKQHLLERKKMITERMNKNEQDQSLSHSTGELSQYDNHPADTATDLYEREKDIALHVHLEQESVEIDHALQKFTNGTFGMCEASGEIIPYERLEANPTSRTIISEANQGQIPDDRPVEEDVLEGFNKYNFDNRDDETEFDAEDAYQSVARFNDNSMVYEGSSLDETDEMIGSVEQIEGFLSTGIEGYTGAENVQVQHNVNYDKYLDGK